MFRAVLLRTASLQGCLLIRAGSVQGCSPQGWCCSGLLSSGLVSFRAGFLRAGAVQGCSPRVVGLQLELAMAAFRKPVGTANGSN